MHVSKGVVTAGECPAFEKHLNPQVRPITFVHLIFFCSFRTKLKMDTFTKKKTEVYRAWTKRTNQTNLKQKFRTTFDTDFKTKALFKTQLQFLWRRSVQVPSVFQLDWNRFSRVLGEEADRSIGSWGENPGLRRVKGHVQDSQVVSDYMTLQHLHRDQQRVLEQVTGTGSEPGGKKKQSEKQCQCQ